MTHSVIPLHVAIIMDGNGRWAKQRFLPRSSGHKAGGQVVRDIIQHATQTGIGVLSLFAFSHDNWHRPDSEVNFLMALFLRMLNTESEQLHQHNIRIKFVGDRARFAVELRDKMQFSEELTAQNSGLVLVIAINYSGQWDILQAVKKVVHHVHSGTLSVEQINANILSTHLSLQELPDPDLLIRTSGEQRISNFFLWQLAYTEIYFSPKWWPDFTVEDFDAALAFYRSRERRFGRTSDQLNKVDYV